MEYSIPHYCVPKALWHTTTWDRMLKEQQNFAKLTLLMMSNVSLAKFVALQLMHKHAHAARSVVINNY